MNYNNPFIHLEGISNDEMTHLSQITSHLTESQRNVFYQIYSTRRKKAQDILLFTLLGLVIVAGVQRFVLGQIAMGVIYLFTGGFCLIGTIVDLVNHKTMTDEYNRKVASEVILLIK